MSYTSSFVHDFIRQLKHNQPADPIARHAEIPWFDIDNASDRELLVTHSSPCSFTLGTGASIYTDVLIPALTTARHEVILVTCFWARSTTLSALHEALVQLAAHRCALLADARSKATAPIPPLRVRICFSSRSLLQKLLHPQSRDGYVYPPSSWKAVLGLPEPALLESAAIQLQVKSHFFLPFSVMHPKFVVVDRQRAFIPSCNVSWEPWLEGCVEVTGAAVSGLLSFYSRTWDPECGGTEPPLERNHLIEPPAFDVRMAGLILVASTAHRRVALLPESPSPIPTLLLPSSCHRNPHFRPFPWQKDPEPPATPLNVALLTLLNGAGRSIYIQTPNLTCQAVLRALLDALRRGVDVAVVTSRNLMLLEQLVTAGTTTSRCIRSLLRRYKKLERRLAENHPADVEAGHASLGRLRISYFCPRPGLKTRTQRRQRPSPAQVEEEEEEPVHSHLKLIMVDDEYTVLGSGNLDRASWYTSQELGILFQSSNFANTVGAEVDGVLADRLDLVFDSAVH
ncbi:hypothetical protein QBC40DRAFT_5436 [Triangularia verruculosa]|uniref:PLD phosphodiesterase domain-containing protein n=1 Tax=Triangularia verruculosa TaxID=2587418 RepID=A0AAN6X9W4_9PEZI|nr:hypothetical protein QBC40DRAFT_5436 [Triangularia verruculosa]